MRNFAGCALWADNRFRQSDQPAMPHIANRIEGLRFRIVLSPGVAIGPGKADLLQAIDETASLTAAAARFSMSYKRGWTLVQELNTAFTDPLVETEKGGAGGGGGAALTELGRFVLERYRRMEADANAAIASGMADLRRHLKKRRPAAAAKKAVRKTPRAAK
ncbi:MAG: LysR family transcriptional regulator [Bauldia sp.]